MAARVEATAAPLAMARITHRDRREMAEGDHRRYRVDDVGDTPERHPGPAFGVGHRQPPEGADPEHQIPAAHGPGQEPGRDVASDVAHPGSGHQRRGDHRCGPDAHPAPGDQSGKGSEPVVVHADTLGREAIRVSRGSRSHSEGGSAISTHFCLSGGTIAHFQ